MKNIEFTIPKSETIPTRLRLKIGEEIQVIYGRAHDKFAYNFEVYGIKEEAQGLEVVKEIASIMCNQSYDHGAEWRVTEITLTEPLQWGGAKWEVAFRIKDSY